MFKQTAILGAGSWGMAIGRLLHSNGLPVRMWEFDRAEYEKLVATRMLPDKLPGFTVPEEIELSNDARATIQDCDLIILAVPSQSLRKALAPLKNHIPPDTVLVNLAKGIETTTLKRMSEIIVEVLGHPSENVATLSGPSHAEEVIADLPTTVTVASHSASLVERLQPALSNQTFRVYQSLDLVGVELAGSLKNIIAIGAGITAGLRMGDNTLGALITRGLAEITRLGHVLGAEPGTFSGLSGIGDLITTCASQHSRNRYVGEQIGKGRSLDEILDSMSMVAEGVQTTKSGYELAKLHNVEMPITEQVHKVLFDNKSPRTAVEELMLRPLKPEIWK